MKAGNIADVYKTRIEKLLEHYHKLPGNFEARNIHHFRLEIKKLRAFLRLIKFSLTKKPGKIPKELKSFYNLTGNIRNLQLHRQQVVNICTDLLLQMPAVYLQRLDEEEKLIRKEAGQMAKKISIKDFENKLVEQVTKKLRKENQIEFIRQELAKLNQLLALLLYTDEALHEIRKIIKDFMYNSKYIEPALIPGGFYGLHGLKSMNTLTTILGDYHDLCISLLFLDSTQLTQMAGMEEKEVLDKLNIQVQLRKDSMKTEIVELMKKLTQDLDEGDVEISLAVRQTGNKYSI